MEPSFPTPSIALGTILNQIGYLMEEQAIQMSFVSAFSLYHLIAPSLAELLKVLCKHKNMDTIPSITPPNVNLFCFCQAIGRIHLQLTDEEYATVPGVPQSTFELHASNHSTHLSADPFIPSFHPSMEPCITMPTWSPMTPDPVKHKDTPRPF
ncbi:hypothetical protein BS47DRAFT_1387586 [Hydnum rufescens UP504]|uniref:Uncharacterized protein n=1 Tax=Hydnum rufescens UP504 TaxID=1448309 RepID=A0A9P6B8Z2_9AGAM|nr:hypothetical protein BS47DRAFT_1387586 [Hydnum rufescens UP504]